MPQYLQNNPGSKIQTKANVGSGAVNLEVIGPAELGLVVDRSGSMAPLAAQLIESFNTLLSDQKSIPATPPLVSLSVFNDSVQNLYDAIPTAEVPPLCASTYLPAGGTALNDAIGSMIHRIGKRARRSTRVLIAILTDGGENSSRSFSTDDVLHMISYRRSTYDWQFIFIGPRSSIDYGLKIGVPRSNIVEFDPNPDSLKLLMVRLSKSIQAYQLGDRKYALKLKN